MPLIGNTWIDDNEHPTPWACMEWIRPTTGEHRFRNTANTAWVDHGNVNEQLGGAVDASGDDMTGPLLGAHGLPPLANPDFEDSARVEGETLATVNQLAKMQRFILGRMSQDIKQTFLSLKKLEAGQTNPTVVKECRFWMGIGFPFSPDNPLVIQDPVQVGDFFDIESTAIEIKQSGYYRFEDFRLAAHYRVFVTSEGTGGQASRSLLGSCDIRKNGAVIYARDEFPNAKGHLARISGDVHNLQDAGAVFSHVRDPYPGGAQTDAWGWRLGSLTSDPFNYAIPLAAGDVLTFTNPKGIMAGNGYIWDDITGARYNMIGTGWVFAPIGLGIRLVTLT